MAVKVTSLPRPKSFDLCRLVARSYTNLSATRILSYIMYELFTFLLEIFICFNCLLCISSFYRIRLWELSSSFVLVDESSPCSTAK